MAFKLEFNDTFTAKSPDPKLVSPPEAKVSYSFDADADLKTDEGKELQGIIAAEFNKIMKDWRAEQEKKFNDAIKWTVENYNKKKEKAEKEKALDKFKTEMVDFVNTCNQMLKQGVQTMLDQVKSVAESLFKKAIELVNKKLKRKITLKKVAAVAKILAFTGLIIAVAALSIAATVLTGGAALPLIAGAIATGIGAVKKIYDTANKAWPSRDKAAKALSAAFEDYLKAVAYELKKQQDEEIRSLGPKERLKRMLNSVEGKKKVVVSTIKDLETWGNATKISIEKMAQESKTLTADVLKLAKSDLKPGSDQFKQWQVMDQASKKLILALSRLIQENKGIDELISAAKVEIAKEIPDQGKITGLIGKLQNFLNSQPVQDLSDAVSILSGAGSNAKKVFGAL